MRLDPDLLNDRPTVRLAVIAALLFVVIAGVAARPEGAVVLVPALALGAFAVWMHRSMAAQSRAAKSVCDAARRLARGERVTLEPGGGDPWDLLRTFGEAAERLHREREELRRSCGLANASFESASDGAYWLDESGQILNANAAACETSGVSPGEAFDHTIFDIDPVLTPERWCDMWRRMTRGEPVTHESVHRDADGREFPVLIHARIAEHGGTSIGCLTARDTTEEKRVESAIRSLVATPGDGREGFLRTLCESVSRALGMRIGLVAEIVGEGSARVLASSGHDGIVPGMQYGLLGTPCSEVVSRGFCVYDREVSRRFPVDAMLGDLGAESYIGIRLYDSAGTFFGLLLAVDDEPIEDLSRAESLMRLFAARASAEIERLRQEDELVRARDEARRLAAVAECVENIVLILDDNWCVEWSNASFEGITGVSADDIRGVPPFVTLAGDKTDFETVRRLRGVQNSGSPTAGELCLRSAGGEDLWLDVRVKPMPGEESDSPRFLVVAREIAEDRASFDRRGRDAA